MITLHDPEILELAVQCLHAATRRIVLRTLEAPGKLEVSSCRRIERLMRIAGSLAEGGSRKPYVQVHGIPPAGGPGSLPEIFSVTLTDLLAGRASDHLAGALQGDAAA